MSSKSRFNAKFQKKPSTQAPAGSAGAQQGQRQPVATVVMKQRQVDSLLAEMKDGIEYNSIVSLVPKNGEIAPDIKQAIADIEKIRGRTCVCYVANVVKPIVGSSIDTNDDLPFNEMLSCIDPGVREIDVFLVTPGGLGHQVSLFVNALRQRFDRVEFILPHMCMSAGTLWALSGDKIWMDRRAFIGPIDPQVRTKNGGMVPAQSVLNLLDKIQKEGQEAISKKQAPPWHLIRLIDGMDPKEVGYAVTASEYSIKMAAEFLAKYKFRTWTEKEKTKAPIDEKYRQDRAMTIATRLCENGYWKSHAHGISREMAINDLEVKIDALESVPNLERAVRRLWALYYYLFDRTNVAKAFQSGDYTLMKFGQRMDNLNQ